MSSSAGAPTRVEGCSIHRVFHGPSHRLLVVVLVKGSKAIFLPLPRILHHLQPLFLHQHRPLGL